MDTKAPIHLICGSTGAGKTTYAMRLAEDIGGVRFSIDEWMTALYWMDAPQPIDAIWATARVERCMTQIWSVAATVANRGVPCVLDFGFGEAKTRTRFAERAAEADLRIQLHVLDVPAPERWRRVAQRNAAKGESNQLTFAVTREMFDYVETLWEPPTADEIRRLNGVVVPA